MTGYLPLRNRVKQVVGMAVVDESDLQRAAGQRWHLTKQGYVAGHIRRGNRHRYIFLHRFLIGETPGLQVDHINGDKLDNRRCNLRLCTAAQNGSNRPSYKNTSGVKGVIWNKECKKWHAQIGVNRRLIYLGLYENIDDAAEAYRSAARRYHGDFANTGIKK